MQGFKEFILRGNVVELAVAVVIGAAFANVVAAFVDLLTNLTEQCATLLDVSSAGLLLADGRGHLHLMAATSARTEVPSPNSTSGKA